MLSSSQPFPLSKIWVEKDRQRKVLGDLSELKQSMTTHGILNPIVIEENGRLCAGERRYTCAKQLGWEVIEVRFLKDLSNLELKAIELHENIFREDLTWQEICIAVDQYHKLAQRENGAWSAAKTAATLDLSEGHVSKYLAIATEFTDNRVNAAASFQTAYQQAQRIKEKREADTMSDLRANVDNLFNDEEEKPKAPSSPSSANIVLPSPPAPALTPVALAEEMIQNKSFIDWWPTYSGRPFQLIHCDFPYGINMQDSEQGGAAQGRPMYDDNPHIYFELLDNLIQSLHRIAADDCTILFWLSNKFRRDTEDRFIAANCSVLPDPLIWGKSDQRGIVADVQRRPRHTYETCLIVRVGDPKIITPKSDFYHSPTVREPGSHSSEKPEPMLSHFFQMYVDEFTRVLDPTCGSGSAIRAAVGLNAKQALGLEINPEYCEASRERLASAIRKARAAKAVSK